VSHIQTMTREQRRAAAKYLEKESKRYPAHLVSVPLEDMPPSTKAIAVWRNREYLVQVYHEKESGVVARLSINRTSLDALGGWRQDIPWEDMQRLKREAGYGGFDAVEVFPRDMDVVNVANMRHLWVLQEQLPFAWRKP